MQRRTCLLVAMALVIGAGCDMPSTEPPLDPVPQSSPVARDTISAMAFNIFHDRASEPLRIASWDGRRDIVVRTIVEADADIVGLQEAYMWQVGWLVLQLPQYSHVGRGREAGGSGESVSILFRADRFTLQESGNFWLSPTPDEPGSMGGVSWGSMTVPRIVTWARLGFADSDRELYVYNTHLPADENGGPEARRLGVILLAERIAARSSPDVPFILLGDLNSTESDFPIRYLERQASASDGRFSPVDVVDTWRQVNASGGGTRCRNDASGAPIVHGNRVDYVLAMDTTRTAGSAPLRSTAEGILASTTLPGMPSCGSDHVGVVSRFVVP